MGCTFLDEPSEQSSSATNSGGRAVFPSTGSGTAWKGLRDRLGGPLTSVPTLPYDYGTMSLESGFKNLRGNVCPSLHVQGRKYCLDDYLYTKHYLSYTDKLLSIGY